MLEMDIHPRRGVFLGRVPDEDKEKK